MEMEMIARTIATTAVIHVLSKPLVSFSCLLLDKKGLLKSCRNTIQRRFSIELVPVSFFLPLRSKPGDLSTKKAPLCFKIFAYLSRGRYILAFVYS